MFSTTKYTSLAVATFIHVRATCILAGLELLGCMHWAIYQNNIVVNKQSLELMRLRMCYEDFVSIEWTQFNTIYSNVRINIWKAMCKPNIVQLFRGCILQFILNVWLRLTYTTEHRIARNVPWINRLALSVRMMSKLRRTLDDLGLQPVKCEDQCLKIPINN